MRGRKIGGRKPGTPNKKSPRQSAKVTADTPLQFLSKVYRNSAVSLGLRIKAARAAAPFCHARFATLVEPPPAPPDPIPQRNLLSIDKSKLDAAMLKQIEPAITEQQPVQRVLVRYV